MDGWMDVCMYVSMNIYIYICYTYVCVYVCIYEYIYIYVIHMYVCMYLCKNVCMQYMYNLYVYFPSLNGEYKCVLLRDSFISHELALPKPGEKGYFLE